MNILEKFRPLGEKLLRVQAQISLEDDIAVVDKYNSHLNQKLPLGLFRYCSLALVIIEPSTISLDCSLVRIYKGQFLPSFN